jgi:GTP diphosphokinase / guanosine-3',5'-bis(diphosphate) 3'-diphosphatase
MTDLAPSELLLVGYVSLTSEGFALPCFAISAQPNAWYTARCSISADHDGKVVGFELFESDDITGLPSELRRPVGIGSQWTDVFVWKGRVLVGAPTEIWDGLGTEREEMLSTIPISGLDLP